MGSHKNNIGLLRLILAMLVIIGHAPEMIDGNREREPLTVIFHTMSLGGVAVNGFFVLSGYLIANSMVASKTLSSYLSRRVLRIYPAFVLAYLLSVLLLAPLVGGRPEGPLRILSHIAMLQEPSSSPGLLQGLHYPALNGSMWTIAYEFRCYLLVAVLAVGGVLVKRYVVLALTFVMVLASIAVTYAPVLAWCEYFDAHWHLFWLVGQLSPTIRLTSVFLVGVSAYNFRREIVEESRGWIAIVCVLFMIPVLFFDHLAETALTTLGAYALFWLAFRANLGPLQRINDRWDISYGVYLYGWPVAITLLWYTRTSSPWTLTTVTIPIVLCLGAASWWGLERWAKDLGRSRPRAVVVNAPAS